MIRNALSSLWLVIVTATLGNAQGVGESAVRWSEVAPGVWKGVVGKPEAYNLLKAADARPNLPALQKLGRADFPLPKAEIVAQLNDGKTAIRFPLQRGEQLYGFGLNFQAVHQRGAILQLHVDHYGGIDNGRTHAPVPFYVSSDGYGVFINSARYLNVYAGSGVRKDSPNPPVVQDRNADKNWQSRPYSDAVEILVPAGGVELFVFAGPKPLDAVRRFNLFNGGGPLPPRWGLGFMQRTHQLHTAEQVTAEVAAYAEKKYPLDMLGLEAGWQSGVYPCTFTWDTGRFPQPQRFVNDLLQKGIRVNLWTNPYVSPASPLHKALAPYTSSHTVWVGAVPDFTMPQARAIFWNKFDQDHVAIGVSGYKLDEVDGYDRYLWPDVATFPSGLAAEQMRQTYGLLVLQQSIALFHKRNVRTYGLARGTNGGGVSFPYVLYNDRYNHQEYITGLVNSGFSGLLWTPEMRGAKTGEEWLRRMQTVCFSPMALINSWVSGTKPWSFPDVADAVQETALLRMRMMPYWYSAFADYHFAGTPPFRAMNLEDGFGNEAGVQTASATTAAEENPYAEALTGEIKDQYMAGESLLVAPLFTGETARKVVLPTGNWYDFYTGAYVGNGEIITVKPGLETIPVFVRDGGIVPLMPPLLHAPKAGQKVDLEIRHYGEKEGLFRLYDDDGETYNYEKGEYTWRTIRVSRQREAWQGTISAPETGKPNSVGKVVWKFMTVK